MALIICRVGIVVRGQVREMKICGLFAFDSNRHSPGISRNSSDLVMCLLQKNKIVECRIVKLSPHFDKLRSVQTCRSCIDNRNEVDIIGPTLESWWRGLVLATFAL